MDKRCLLVNNYYEIIGVSPRASVTEIKARYRELSKTYHPDMGGSQEHMALLNEAYRVLSNPLQRTAFDRRRAQIQAAAREAAAARNRQTTWQSEPTAEADPFEAVYQTVPVKKPSRFWKFMAWSTAVYTIVGLAIIFFATTQGTASADTAQTSSPSSATLTKQATDASADIPETPSTAQSSSAAESTTDTAQNTSTDSTQQPTDNSTSNQPTADETCASAAACAPTTTEQPKKHYNWRRLIPF